MGFRDALLQKIAIDGLALKVRRSLQNERETGTIDRESLRRLFAVSRYEEVLARDLELYVRKGEGDVKDIIVLDNGLARYRTTVSDVLLRKSPTVKEMVRFRNARKILSDGDVLVEKRGDTLATLQRHCIGLLPLSCGPAEVAALCGEGILALEIQDAGDVETCLILFEELLGHRPPPFAFRRSGWRISCRREGKGDGAVFRDLVVFERASLRLWFLPGPFRVSDPAEKERFSDLLESGGKGGFPKGSAVFEHLAGLFTTYDPL